jgi:tRNA pseudouridine55 synthase
MNGFFNVLKPPGMTSSQVVGAVRRLINGEKAGHAGTLDPQAAGILPVMAGKAARLFDYLVDKRKTYVAEIAFGAATDTQDAQGRMIDKGENYPSLEDVKAVLPRFTGEIMQAPPSFSAIKQNGQRLYDLARRGEMVSAEPRPIRVEDISLGRETDNHGMMLTIRCGKGTYVRTLCHDIGLAVGCPAHMRFLLRTQSGVFTLDSAYTLEELQMAKDEERLLACLLPMDMPLEHLLRVDVPRELENICRNGGPMQMKAFVNMDQMAENAPLRVYLYDAFMGIAQLKGSSIVFRAMVGGGINDMQYA